MYCLQEQVSDTLIPCEMDPKKTNFKLIPFGLLFVPSQFVPSYETHPVYRASLEFHKYVKLLVVVRFYSTFLN